MDLIKIIRGQPVPYSIEAFRRDHPNEVLPLGREVEVMGRYHVHRVIPDPKPEGRKVEPAPAPEYRGGKWYRGWVEVPVAKEDVQAERARRILAGSTFTVAGYDSGIRLAGDVQTTTNLHARVTNAQIAISQGVGDPVFAWRDEDNVVHALTPAQIIDLYSQASMYVDAVYRASWALIDNPPIPQDFAADERWPERSL